jgi:hypothetical protein
MCANSIWAWAAGAVAGWVFLGLVAGRFAAMRNRLGDPGRGRLVRGRVS